MDARQSQIHYLRPNERQFSPAHVAFIDTEATVIPGSDPETLALLLWESVLIDRRVRKGRELCEVQGHGKDAPSLAAWLDAQCTGRATVWVFAHNLAFDLVTTRLPLQLAALGWEVTDAALGGRSPWLRMRHGTRRICMVDSGGWLPYPLARIGEAVGVTKPSLPKAADDERAWRARCRADVNIMATAMLDLMDWWDRNNRGNWSITGSATGWNAYRHTHSMYRVIIDPDPAGVAHDRQAIYGGRRGVWRVGQQTAGPFLELDMTAAYPSVAAHLPLPVKRCQEFDTLPVDDWRIDSERYGVIARVRLRTDVPRWPLRVDGATFYPTGEFQTVLCGPEIAEARRLGCLVVIGPGRVHKLGYALTEWAQWCLATQRGEHPDSPPAVQLACKAWGRTVIGKWAARAWEKIELGASPTDAWGYEEGFDHESQQRGGFLDLAGRRWWVYAAGDSENSYPAVFAWVESQVRVRLGRLIDAIGPGCVVQCDTDGFIVAERNIGTRSARGHLRAPETLSGAARTKMILDCVDPVIAPLTVRVKRTAPHVTVLGPQHLELGGQRRLAGIRTDSLCADCLAFTQAHPDAAEQLVCMHVAAGGTYTAKQWPGLQWQMGNGSAAGYVRPEVTARTAATYVPAWVTTTGRTVPPHTEISTAGETRIVSWHAMNGHASRMRLTQDQHPVLDALL